MTSQTISRFLLAPLSLLLLSSVAHAENAAEILEKHERAKADELREYVDENPEAEDRLAAISLMADSLRIVDDEKALTQALEEKFSLIPKNDETDLGDLFSTVVAPLTEVYQRTGEKQKAMTMIEGIRSDFSKHPMKERIGEFLDDLAGGLNQPVVGETMELAFTAVNGDKVDISKMKGKVVLVDFWATWCGPCVNEMPNVIAAYKKHHDNGFEIIGVSLDEDKAEMEEFIKKNGMGWPQHFDGKGWQNEISTSFGISSIPATFLVGPDGKIAAADLRGAALDAKIAELLAKK